MCSGGMWRASMQSEDSELDRGVFSAGVVRVEGRSDWAPAAFWAWT